MLSKNDQRLRRSKQTRTRIALQRVARLTVHRTNLHIYASVISDDGTRVLASASTAEADVRKDLAGDSKARARAATSPPRRSSASASPRRPRPPASRRSRSIAPVSATTAASRRWPTPRAKPACSSDRRERPQRK